MINTEDELALIAIQIEDLALLARLGGLERIAQLLDGAKNEALESVRQCCLSPEQQPAASFGGLAS